MRAGTSVNDRTTGPSFFIVGAPRSGTTAMHRLLALHPALHMSEVKEPNHYLFDGEPPSFGGPLGELLASQVVSRREDYLALFRTEASSNVAHRGESSPFYLYSDVARQAIARDIPDAKILILLRDPVRRAHSHYVMLRRDEREPAATFSEALDLERERLERGWALSYGYERLSRYASFVPQWIDTFGERVLVLTHEEFRSSHNETVRKVCEFLAIEPIGALLEHNREENLSGVPRSRRLHRLLASHSAAKRAVRSIFPGKAHDVASAVRRWNLPKPPLLVDDAQRLRRSLAPQAQQMEEILGPGIHQWTTTLTGMSL